MLEYGSINKRLKETQECLKIKDIPSISEMRLRQILENQQTILEALHVIDFNTPKSLMAKRK